MGGGAIVIRQMKALLSLDAAGFHKGIDGAESRLQKFAAGMTRIGRTMTAAFTLPIVAGFGFAVKAASDLEEATSAAAQVYGAGADVIIAKSKASAAAVGLSSAEYLT